MNKLTNYLKDRDSDNPIKDLNLPIFHACTYDDASEYAYNRRISLTYCAVFKKHMIYLFLGRSQFKRLDDSDSLKLTPICFIFRPKNNIDLKAVFPFDTGAIAFNRYTPIIDNKEIEKALTKYSIAPDLRLAYQLILLFFGTVRNYLTPIEVKLTFDQAREIARAENIPEIEDIYGVYTCPWIKTDKRKLTVELHAESDLLLTSKNLAGIMIPLELGVNKEFQSIIKETNGNLLFYDQVSSLVRSEYYGEITEKSIKLSIENGN